MFRANRSQRLSPRLQRDKAASSELLREQAGYRTRVFMHRSLLRPALAVYGGPRAAYDGGDPSG